MSAGVPAVAPTAQTPAPGIYTAPQPESIGGPSIGAVDYQEQLFALLPPGRIWTRRGDSTLWRLLSALSAMLQGVHVRAGDLLGEVYAPSTVELLPEWERLLGLPDPCIGGRAQTLQERRTRVVERLTVQPNATVVYLQQLAVLLGYPSTIFSEGPGPFDLTVAVSEGRVTYFRVGESRCGDLLGKFDQADDLECLLREQKPAHVNLIFNYSGA